MVGHWRQGRVSSGLHAVAAVVTVVVAVVVAVYGWTGGKIG